MNKVGHFYTLKELYSLNCLCSLPLSILFSLCYLSLLRDLYLRDYPLSVIWVADITPLFHLSFDFVVFFPKQIFFFSLLFPFLSPPPPPNSSSLSLLFSVIFPSLSPSPFSVSSFSSFFLSFPSCSFPFLPFVYLCSQIFYLSFLVCEFWIKLERF